MYLFFSCIFVVFKNQKKIETEEELEIKKQLSNHSHIEEKEASESGSRKYRDLFFAWYMFNPHMKTI